jgi:hypothetical protein
MVWGSREEEPLLTPPTPLDGLIRWRGALRWWSAVCCAGLWMLLGLPAWAGGLGACVDPEAQLRASLDRSSPDALRWLANQSSLDRESICSAMGVDCRALPEPQDACDPDNQDIPCEDRSVDPGDESPESLMDEDLDAQDGDPSPLPWIGRACYTPSSECNSLPTSAGFDLERVVVPVLFELPSLAPRRAGWSRPTPSHAHEGGGPARGIVVGVDQPPRAV